MWKYENIPDELKRLKQWVCWTNDKMPKNPYTGGNAQSNNSSTWGSFEDAVAACDKFLFDGVGFMFANGYFGVDLDDHGNGLPEELKDEFIHTLQSYTETSRSGNGIHIICKGSLPDGARRKGNVEMYQTGRYFIMTGNICAEYAEISDCTDSIKELHAKHLVRKPAAVASTQTVEPIDMTDSELIDKARSSKSGVAFQMLYSGSWQGVYNSQSDADLALCNMLAFWTQKDKPRIDRIFRSSGLMRDKWDRTQVGTTYGNITIDKAIAGCSQVYNPMDAAEDIIVSTTGGVEVKATKQYDMTDTGNAKRFADMYRGQVKYNNTNQTWHYWDGSVWVTDMTLEIKVLADKCIEKMKRDAATIKGEDEQKAAFGWAYSTESSARKEAMLKESRHLPKIATTPNEFDADPDILNCTNGIINLSTGEIIQHDSNFMCSRISEVNTSTNPPERWLQFIDEITCGDKDLAKYLQKCVGYSLTGLTTEQCAFFCYGSGGNGKSVFLNTVAEMMGNYAMNIQPDVIMSKKGGNDNTSEIARLKGARLVTTAEPDQSMVLNEGLVKQLTGGEPMTARFLYGQPFEFRPEFKLWMTTNHKPIIKGTDNGIWRRIRLIPFLANIPSEQMDRTLPDKLKAELGGILSWAIEGCKLWKQEGLNDVPQCIKDATDEYRNEMDILNSFCDTCIDNINGARTKASDLFKVYSHWAKSNNEWEMSSTRFGKEIVKRFPKIRTGNGIMYEGVQIRPEFNKQFYA